MDELAVWIAFYLLLVALFYWCFRKSMQAVQDTPAARISATNARSNERRMAFTAGVGRNVYLVTDETRRSDASDQSQPNPTFQPPPEYKWEDVPPTYEEAMRSYTNQAFEDPSAITPQPSTSCTSVEVVVEQPTTPPSADS